MVALERKFSVEVDAGVDMDVKLSWLLDKLVEFQPFIHDVSMDLRGYFVDGLQGLRSSPYPFKLRGFTVVGRVSPVGVDVDRVDWGLVDRLVSPRGLEVREWVLGDVGLARAMRARYGADVKLYNDVTSFTPGVSFTDPLNPKGPWSAVNLDGYTVAPDDALDLQRLKRLRSKGIRVRLPVSGGCERYCEYRRLCGQVRNRALLDGLTPLEFASALGSALPSDSAGLRACVCPQAVFRSIDSYAEEAEVLVLLGGYPQVVVSVLENYVTGVGNNFIIGFTSSPAPCWEAFSPGENRHNRVLSSWVVSEARRSRACKRRACSACGKCARALKRVDLADRLFSV